MNTVTVYMTADKFWDLLSKKITAEASEDELNEFDELVGNHPDWKKTTETLEILWQQSPTFENNDATEALKLHVEKIKQLGIEFNEYHSNYPEIIPEEKSHHSKTKKWLFSVVGVVIIVVGFFVFKNITTTQNKTPSAAGPISQVITESGSRTHLQLPDGSSVWLNASSDLTYDKNFGKNLREVNLTGEAFFDVVKDAAHPFIIHTKVIDVKVLGTQFDVKAYPNDAYTEASLIRGSVEVTVKSRPNEKHYLKPNEKISVANNITNEVAQGTTKSKPYLLTEPLTYYHVDSTVIETSWVENKLIFQENETFREVALKMERWYGVHIHFADEEVAQIRP